MDHPQTNVSAYTAPFYRGLTDEQCRLIHCATFRAAENESFPSEGRSFMIFGGVQDGRQVAENRQESV